MLTTPFRALAVFAALAFPCLATAASEYEGRPVQGVLQRQGKDLGSQLVLEKTLSTAVDRTETRVEYLQAQVPYPQCNGGGGGGGGAAGDWKGYWEAPQHLKAGKLADAVQGIGLNMAQRLVEGGYLRFRPATWEAFSAEINRAEQQFHTGFSRDVLGRYGEENRRSLGYASSPLPPGPVPGGNGDWKGYWEAPHPLKPERLAAAIRGLTLAEARRIVDAGFFAFRPRDWQELVSQVKTADQYTRAGFSFRVLSTYGVENMRMLGYLPQPSCQLRMQHDSLLNGATVKVVDHYVTRNFRLEISNAPLLTGEKESFSIHFDGLTDRVLADSPFNSYRSYRQEHGSTILYRLDGSRQLATPVNTLSADARNQGGEMVVTVRDAGFDGELGNRLGEAIVQVETYLNVSFGFDKKLGSTEYRLAPGGGPAEIRTAVQPPARKKGYVKVSIKRMGSQFHNARFSEAIRSGDAQF